MSYNRNSGNKDENTHCYRNNASKYANRCPSRIPDVDLSPRQTSKIPVPVSKGCVRSPENKQVRDNSKKRVPQVNANRFSTCKVSEPGKNSSCQKSGRSGETKMKLDAECLTDPLSSWKLVEEEKKGSESGSELVTNIEDYSASDESSAQLSYIKAVDGQIDSFEEALHYQKKTSRNGTEIEELRPDTPHSFKESPDSKEHKTGKCHSERRRNYLKTKLKELMSEIEPIPENVFPENVELKPEPEAIAAALLMSENEDIDLGIIKPETIFDKLFSGLLHEQPITIASAAPEPMNDVVVPVMVQGQKSATVTSIPIAGNVGQRTKDTIPQNSNALQDSGLYQTFSSYRNEILQRVPPVDEVLGYFGGTKAGESGQGKAGVEDNVLEYVMRPELGSYRNRVRLNGTIKPCWFPGYTVVSPLLPECIGLTSDPGEALHEGWRLCRPRHFDEYSKSSVNID